MATQDPEPALPAGELVRVRAGALVLVQQRDVLDVGGGQLEVEDVDVLPDPVPGDRLGEHDVASLDVPAQDNLSRGLAGSLGDGLYGRVAEDTSPPQRSPALDRDLMFGAEGAHLVLGQVRVLLDLIDRRDDVGLAVQPPQVMGLEVGDPDGPGPALAVELLQRPPGLYEVTAVPGRQRPVDQEEVDVLGAESLER